MLLRCWGSGVKWAIRRVLWGGRTVKIVSAELFQRERMDYPNTERYIHHRDT
jgi:hypothetical protein